MQQEQAQRVWQRVRGEGAAQPENPESWLSQLISDQAQETALWQQLGRSRGGIYGTVARQKQAMLHCLRGIYFLAAGQHHQSQQPRPERADLRRSAARGMALWKVFDGHSRDPDFGPAFQSLRERQREHCRVTLELLGAQNSQ